MSTWFKSLTNREFHCFVLGLWIGGLLVMAGLLIGSVL